MSKVSAFCVKSVDVLGLRHFLGQSIPLSDGPRAVSLSGFPTYDKCFRKCVVSGVGVTMHSSAVARDDMRGEEDVYRRPVRNGGGRSASDRFNNDHLLGE